MKNYALLCHPGFNRVYAEQAAKFCAKELNAAACNSGIELLSAENKCIADGNYLFFSCKEELSEHQLQAVARLSSFFTLFELLPNGAFMPVKANADFAFPENIVTLLKYGGKTNEQFTHLMVHLGLCAGSSRKKPESRLRLLDPLCGKGTTLFTAMRFGMDAAGIEISSSWVQQAQTFLTQYFERGGYKRRITKEKRSDEKARKIADVTNFVYAADKRSFKENDLRELRLIRADTLLSKELLPKQSFDILVSDLPYGVLHASRQSCEGKKGKTKLLRSAAKLADAALDGWMAALKPGASIVLAFNTLTTLRKELEEVLTRHGLITLTAPEYTGYAHRVDQSINRDLIAAKKQN